MFIFAVSTSTNLNSFSLFNLREKIKTVTWEQPLKKSDALVEEVDKVFNKLSFDYQKIQTLLLDIGPGSFTGCRISTNFIKTLASQINIPVFTIISLDVICYQNSKPENFLAVIDANGSLYYAKSLADKTVSLIPHSQINNYNKALTVAMDQRPESETMVRMYLSNPDLFNKHPWQEVEPLYIRAPEVVEKSSKQAEKQK
ncbi:MAG: tRNA (adenosine(37)-N6)-threonylcarbamoyltransferase complex dimerization subunit type 1 TsaB [Oligoflexia bacterium]|nr:tRNA (adenosine(37)-N6)-threonylcarbamoyltransferase complex dimerization subunit type 1 TsaB [Oligoflexia bacterium]